MPRAGFRPKGVILRLLRMLPAFHDLRRAVGLIWPLPHFSVELGDVRGCDLFGLTAPELRQHDPVQEASIVCGRLWLPLRVNVFGEIDARQFSQG